MRRKVGRIRWNSRRGAPSVAMPVITFEGAAGGPVAVVTANVHGDELTGVEVVQRLDRWAAEQHLLGTLVLYPSLNPDGLRQRLRQVPDDGLDLNRNFPGSVTGSYTEQLAAAVWSDLVERRPQVLIDLHADSADSVPYVIVDRPAHLRGHARRRFGERLGRLADSTGLIVLREYVDDLYLRFGLDRSLAGAAVNVLGIPAITIEAGPRRLIDEASVESAFRATVGALASVGMVQDESERSHGIEGGPWRRSTSPRARRAGLLRASVLPGQHFVSGQLLASIVDLTGETCDEIAADTDGVVISWADSGWVAPGAVLGTLGIRDLSTL